MILLGVALILFYALLVIPGVLSEDRRDRDGWEGWK